jgi:large subunit ribosomal protein L21
MYAIIDNHGKQVRVSAGETIEVDRIDAEVGAEITFDRVLLVGSDDVKVGTPLVEGASVKAKVVSHDRGEKVIAFKFRRRQRSTTRRGFRASLTKLEILEINA